MILNDGVNAGKPLPQEILPPYVEVLGNSVNIRSGPTSQSKQLFTAHKDNGDKYAYVKTDTDTGWYGILTDRGLAFISCRKDLTRLVK